MFLEIWWGDRSHIWQSAKMPKRSCILCPFISYLSFLFKYLYVDNRITIYCLNIFLILFFAITITKILNKTLLCPKTIPTNSYHIYYSIIYNMPICFTYFVEISKILFQFQTHVALNDHNLSLYISIPILPCPYQYIFICIFFAIPSHYFITFHYLTS